MSEYKMVPVEPTSAMHAAWMFGKGPWTERYKALLAAAPTPPDDSELVKALEGLCGLAALRPGHLSDYTAAVNDARQALANYRARKGEQHD